MAERADAPDRDKAIADVTALLKEHDAMPDTALLEEHDLLLNTLR